MCHERLVSTCPNVFHRKLASEIVRGEIDDYPGATGAWIALSIGAQQPGVGLQKAKLATQAGLISPELEATFDVEINERRTRIQCIYIYLFMRVLRD
jgi:hypothetical protein